MALSTDHELEVPDEGFIREAWIFFMNLRHAVKQSLDQSGENELPVQTPAIKRYISKVGEALWRRDLIQSRHQRSSFQKGSPPKGEHLDESTQETCGMYGIFHYESESQVMHHVNLLSDCLVPNWHAKHDSLEVFLSGIATASRSVIWRLPFGGLPPGSVFGQQVRDTRGDDSILANCLVIIQEHEKTDPEPILVDAIRIVANCVAEEDQNRRLAIRKNAVDILMTKVKEQSCINFVVPALQNICNSFNDPALDTTRDPRATLQPPVTEPHVAIAHSHPEEGSIHVLFDLLDNPDLDPTRIPMLSSLIESVTTTAPNDLIFAGVSPTSDVNNALARVLHRFLDREEGSPEVVLLLWRCSTECFLSIIAAFFNVLSIEAAMSIVVSERLMPRLMDIYSVLVLSHLRRLNLKVLTRKENEKNVKSEDDGNENEDEEILQTLRQYAKRLSQAFCTMSGMPIFTQTYTFDSEYMKSCVATICNAGGDSQPELPDYYLFACNVVANIAAEEEIAVELVGDRYEIHLGVIYILNHSSHTETLLQALGLARRLTLAATSQRLVGCGMFPALKRFYSPGLEMLPPEKAMVESEAITVTRMLITSRPKLLKALHGLPAHEEGVKKPVRQKDWSDWTSDRLQIGGPVGPIRGPPGGTGHNFRDLVNLFETCGESSVKVEIGRLFVEHFRTGFVPGDQPRFHCDEIFEEYKPEAGTTSDKISLAEPIAFLARAGPSPAMKSEGWFGLGLMTAVEQHRVDVREALTTPRMLEEIKKVSAEKEEPAAKNLMLILSRIGPNELGDNGNACDVFDSVRLTLGFSGVTVQGKRTLREKTNTD